MGLTGRFRLEGEPEAIFEPETGSVRERLSSAFSPQGSPGQARLLANGGGPSGAPESSSRPKPEAASPPPTSIGPAEAARPAAERNTGSPEDESVGEPLVQRDSDAAERNPAQPRVSRVEAPRDEQLPPGDILVVEDDPSYGDSLAESLQSELGQPTHPLIVNLGTVTEQVQQTLEQHRIGAIVTDGLGMHFPEVAEAAQGRPVILLTGNYGDPKYRAAAEQHGIRIIDKMDLFNASGYERFLRVVRDGLVAPEKVTLPGAGFDKRSGIEYLRDQGLPVPQIYEDWQEAQEHIRTGGQVFGRGYVEGPADNQCIDIFGSRRLRTEADYEHLQRKCADILASPEFAAYAAQFGVDTDGLQSRVLLQEQIGLPQPLRVITMDNGGGEILVQARGVYVATFGGRLSSERLAEEEPVYYPDAVFNTAAQLHAQAKRHLNPTGAFQLEMIGQANLPETIPDPYMGGLQRCDPDTLETTLSYRDLTLEDAGMVGWKPQLSIVQVRHAHPLAYEGVKFPSDLPPGVSAADYVLAGVKRKFGHARVVSANFPELSNQPTFLSKIGRDPYVLELSGHLSHRAPQELQYGNIQGLVVHEIGGKKDVFLQHCYYRPMKLVWQRQGLVVVD